MGPYRSSSPLLKCYSFTKLKLLSLFWAISMTLHVVALSDSDKSVLLQFKNSVSDTSGMLSSWNSVNSNHCTWCGVSCDARSRVVSLNVTGSLSSSKGKNFSDRSAFSCQFPLYGFGIRRQCKGSGGILVGKLLPVVARLSELRVLSLPFNGFVGEIPREVWGMEKLEVLDLEGNSITGSLPVSFSGSRSLRVLNLGFNHIEGEIPDSLSRATGLEVLNLAGNRINGTIPGFVGRFTSVYLSLNKLGGSVPNEIGSECGKLEHLDLSGNLLVGGIPGSLGRCGNLRTLLLHSNLLEEVIPRELGMLEKLEVLDVSRNSLSGSIPAELGKCSGLSVLVLSNAFDPYNDISGWRRDYLSSANEDFNFFQGGIPVEILMLPHLRMLWAPGATLEGRLPSNWGSCDQLEMIDLSHNYFIGEIPREFGRCNKLWYMDFSSNRLSGELAEELPVPCMILFDVSENILSGPFPSFNSTKCPPAAAAFVNVYPKTTFDPSLAYLSFFASEALTGNSVLPPVRDGGISVIHNFWGNNFTGTIQSMPIAPSRLGNQNTYTFSAGQNKLTGPFPGILFDKCDELNGMIVNVSNNRISGQIPTDIDARCRSLKLLDASRNQIGGSFPPTVGELESLVSLNLSHNLFHGQIPASLGRIQGLKHLSLAGNKMTGAIPSSLGKLQSLQVLDLSSNLLSGEIPNDLVNLRNLTTLLLNDNKLFGQIPPGLANVTLLSVFNVSCNNLSGPLPLSANLMKCSSVLGNPFLRPCHVFSLTVPSRDPQGITEAQGVSTTAQTQSRSNNGFNSIEIASIASASAIVSVLIALIILFFYTRKWSPKSEHAVSARKEVKIFTDIGVPLTFENVVRATGCFNASNCIGNGGFGATFKAEISPGVLVAIKRLSVGRFQGIQQFHAEIKTLGRLHHTNLVTLIGYHASETEMFLIYNYLPGGNLEKFIQERSTRAVDWRILHKIALDIARALAYLHDECVPRVLHRDVKPSNILLDDDFNAYLSDFGLARLLGTSETHATTGVAGTFGYVAPEYAMTCRVSDKADVYSYGVVLLELLSDKKALDPSFSHYGNGFNIVAWACMLLRQGRAKEFFTEGLWDVGPHDDLVEVLHLAVVCTVDSLSTRPTMKQVVRRLKQLQPPSC